MMRAAIVHQRSLQRGLSAFLHRKRLRHVLGVARRSCFWQPMRSVKLEPREKLGYSRQSTMRLPRGRGTTRVSQPWASVIPAPIRVPAEWCVSLVVVPYQYPYLYNSLLGLFFTLDKCFERFF